MNTIRYCINPGCLIPVKEVEDYCSPQCAIDSTNLSADNQKALLDEIESLRNALRSAELDYKHECSVNEDLIEEIQDLQDEIRDLQEEIEELENDKV